MEPEQVWVLAYNAVLGIRLHPRNDPNDRIPDIANAHKIAQLAAEQAVDAWKEKFK